MKRRWWIIVGLAVAAALGVAFEPSRVMWGQLTGQAFVNGRPVSYWSGQLTGGAGPRSRAVAQLAESGEDSVAVLRELLRTGSTAEVRWTAAELLGQLGPVAQVASDDLVRATTDADPHVQGVAAAVLPKVDAPATAAVPALIALLRTSHSAVASRALSAYKGAARDALPGLVAVLEDESLDVETRWNAARTLGKLGPEGIESLPVLIRLTSHPEDTLREHCAESIGDIGPLAAAGIPALIDCLDDPATRVRRDAVRSLGYLGEAARVAVPEMKPLLDDPEEMVRAAARNAITAIAPEELPVEPPSPAAANPESPPASPEAAPAKAVDEPTGEASALESSGEGAVGPPGAES